MKTILILGLFALSSREPSAAQNLTFTPYAYTLGPIPTSLVAADVNGDGAIDLISSGGLVLTNNGHGVFGTNSIFSPSFGFGSIAVADVNGDGNLDLIGTSGGGGTPFTLTVLTNNGNGTFSSNATLRVGSPPQWVVTADINGDGKLDLICRETNELTVFTKDGSGVFGYNATLSVGTGYGNVLAVDINGDGKPDLITADGGGPISVLTNSTLTVLTNNGSGIFVDGATVNVGTPAYRVVAADLTGSGRPDLITLNLGTNTLTVFTNDGSGGFGFNTTITVGSYPTSLIAADVNGDGKPDLIVGQGGLVATNTLTVLINETPFPAPALNIVSAGPNNVIISWSSPLTGFALQTNSDLTTTNWALGDYSVSTNGPTKSVTIFPPVAGNLFFRLKQ